MLQGFKMSSLQDKLAEQAKNQQQEENEEEEKIYLNDKHIQKIITSNTIDSNKFPNIKKRILNFKI